MMVMAAIGGGADLVSRTAPPIALLDQVIMAGAMTLICLIIMYLVYKFFED
jgi:hypothetical protein